MRSLLVPFLCFISLIAKSQPKTYAETKRENDARAESQRNLDNLRNQRNAAASSGAAVDKKAVEELVEQFKRNKGGGYVPYQKLSPEQEAAAKALAEREVLEERRRKEQREKWLQDQVASRKTWMQEMMDRNKNSEIPPDDLRDFFYDVFFQSASGYYQMPRAAAGDAYVAFRKLFLSAPYDTLMHLANKARLYPTATQNMYQTIGKRFPEKLAEIELAELKAMPYFFGAIRPDLYPGAGMTAMYPPCQMDDINVPQDRKLSILNRFLDLAQKYPEAALEAAGKCRPRLNPFLSAAFFCKDDACRQEYYLKVLYTKRVVMGVDYIDNDPHQYTRDDWPSGKAEKQLKSAMDWLVANRPQLLQAFSSDEWREIAKRQGVGLAEFQALVGEKNVKKKESKFPNLRKLLK